ncbi:chromosome segregation protein SMC [Halopseudomonas nanhaiensis]|uniref:chromosome segregation protein SMC n=1 Tax=Halopseudomonas nanhaiensis TaxID=2830842 RepID=UPI001CBC730A|nr:chromosome segregation protein SMC [Halopseudomonas nanhaiensis]UAW99402.1 chromosome segregation protein SMC [Halopseudomonas nanhaiensis]
MRLKCIKLAGFKSFVDPTTVYFPTNMGAVVGPNGCGKSNIIDAVRWVMGESSAKNLRGESMTDVIFNGSNSRKPVGQASIELVFDNSEGKLKGEYAGYNEISIRRKVTREAQNQYYLNGTKCRRRDITDIFLGTGLGPRSYSIIEQGMISKLIEAKPDELRLFIEEAAGISKYKERRRETENRIRRTHDNLARLIDLREELERQLSHLHRQAQAAEKYKEYKAEERQLKAQLQALRWQTLDGQVGEREHRVRDLEIALEALIAEQRNADSEIEKQRDQHADLTETFSRVQARFYSVGADISRIEQALQFSRDRQRQLHEDIEQTEQAWQEAQSHLTQDQALLADLQAELAALEPEMDMAGAADEDTAAQLQTAEEAMQAWQAAWDQFNQQASAPRQQAEVEQSRIRHLEQAVERFGERIQRLEDERATLSAGPLDDELAELGEQLAELDLRSESEQHQLADVTESLQLQRETLTVLTQEQDSRRGEIQRQSGRLASLEALQQAALDRGAEVSDWLREQGLDALPPLAEQLTVEPGWELAVETVLAADLQAVSLDRLDRLTETLGSFSQGSLRAVEVAETAGTDAPNGDSLLAMVRCPADLTPWLGSVRTADDLGQAMQRRASLAAHESLITRDGHWLGRNWLRFRRGEASESGVLARQQEIETLQATLQEQELLLDEAQARIAELRESTRDQEQQRDALQQTIARLGREQGDLKAQVSARQVRLEQVNARRQRITEDLEDIRAQRADELEQIGEARLTLQEALDRMADDAGQREALLHQREEVRETVDQARQQARQHKDRAHQLALRVQSLRAQQDSTAQGLERLLQQVERLGERREQLRMTLDESQAPEDDQRIELESLLEQRIDIEQELSAARQALEGVDQQMREQDRRRSQAEQQSHLLRAQLDEQRLVARDLQTRRQGLQEQLLEAGYDLIAVIDTLPEGATESEWDSQLAQLDARIQRLGAINLAAIEEYQQQSERKRYLDAQNADLEEALNTLEQVIRKIDRETRSRFKETFDKVNHGLQSLFPKVFGGGHAYLELTGDDLLDTGVTIMARPPGKKNSTIHLLSGGEKALTAIALVFSIFQLNPAPFCMLDEVDAPLDDANVGRYARMVKEMSSRVQFIYITHNKIAMEMADQLLGVTMHEPGCSRLVTVNVEEAAALAAV